MGVRAKVGVIVRVAMRVSGSEGEGGSEGNGE